jgi:addiction module HigA family antidote
MQEQAHDRLVDAQQGVSPGAHLRAEIERLGLDQVAVAEATEVSRQTINNIVNDRQSISRAMAAKLGRLTGKSSDYWLRSSFKEADHDDGHDITAASTPTNTAASNPFGMGVLVDHQIIRAVHDKVVIFDPFNPENVQAASMDLTLDDFLLTSDDNEVDISDGYDLKPRETVNGSTKEWVQFPLDCFGRVGPMTQFSKYGIILVYGFQIDPGYCGHLQFCLFNAGPKAFPLQSGKPIISLEIVHLSSTPTKSTVAAPLVRGRDSRPDVSKHFDRRASNKEIFDRMIRAYLRKKVQLHAKADMVVAEIGELDVEMINSSEDAAAEGAINSVLDTLKTMKMHRGQVEDSKKYGDFFNEIGENLVLDAEQAPKAIRVIGLELSSSGNVAKLRNGEKVILGLPQGSSKISLKAFARQLHLDVRDVILMLTGLVQYEET